MTYVVFLLSYNTGFFFFSEFIIRKLGRSLYNFANARHGLYGDYFQNGRLWEGGGSCFLWRVILYSGTCNTSSQTTEQPRLTGGVSDPRPQTHTYQCLTVFFTYMCDFILLPHISILREFYLNMYTLHSAVYMC